MKQYLKTGKSILEDGYYQQNRTGVATWSVFGRDCRYDLNEGFPAPTTKKGYFKGAEVELCWMLSGNTNIGYLHQYGVKFWDKWAIQDESQCYMHVPYSTKALFDLLTDEGHRDPIEYMRQYLGLAQESGYVDPVVAYCEKRWGETPEFLPKRICAIGDLGPVYGYLWRHWPNPDGTETDQIQTLIDNLRSNPGSRRHVVSLWHPFFLPDESMTPQQNVANGKQALAPCHWMFEVKVRTYDDKEQIKTGKRGALSLHYHLRSNDWPAGKPVNNMFYALLTHMLAEQTNLDVDVLWYTGTDVHIYEDQVDPFLDQLERKPKKLPKLVNVNKRDSIFDYQPGDWVLENYEHDAHIAYPVAL